MLMLLGARSQEHENADGTHGTGGEREDRPPEQGIDRLEVHQATGMVLVQLEIPGEDAFARLRAYAFARGRPLTDVARDVVARRLVFTDEMD